MTKPSSDSRALRKFLRHKPAVVASFVIAAYGIIAILLLCTNLITLEDTIRRVGPETIPGLGTVQKPEKRLEDADWLVDRIETLAGRNDPRMALDSFQDMGVRRVAQAPLGELDDRIAAAWEIYDQLDEIEDLTAAVEGTLDDSDAPTRAFVLEKLAALEAQAESLLEPMSRGEASARWFEMLLGTDRQGRSIFFRSVYSIRVAILIGLITGLLSVAIGTILGLLSGYFGGWVDNVITWIYSTFASIPNIVLLILLAFIFDGGHADDGLRVAICLGTVGGLGWLTVGLLLFAGSRAVSRSLGGWSSPQIRRTMIAVSAVVGCIPIVLFWSGLARVETTLFAKSVVSLLIIAAIGFSSVTFLRAGHASPPPVLRHSLIVAVPAALLLVFAARSTSPVQGLQSTVDSLWQSLIGGRLDETLIPVYVAFTATFWIGPCRVIRGETLKIRELEYVQAATVMGFGQVRILLKHILPNVTYLMLINFSLLFIGAIKSEVILSFLGLGVKKGPSWGIMISQSKVEVINGFFWQIGTATVFMFLLVLAFNVLSDALQDVFDPKHV